MHAAGCDCVSVGKCLLPLLTGLALWQRSIARLAMVWEISVSIPRYNIPTLLHCCCFRHLTLVSTLWET